MPGTICVACKLPNGVHLELERQETISEPILGGGSREVKQNIKTGERITLRGPAVPFGETPSVRIVGGYALNENVDADFYQKWVEQKKDSILVRERMVFAMPKIEAAADKAKEHSGVKSGLERLDPSSLPAAGNKAITFTKADV